MKLFLKEVAICICASLGVLFLLSIFLISLDKLTLRKPLPVIPLKAFHCKSKTNIKFEVFRQPNPSDSDVPEYYGFICETNNN